VLCSSLNFTDAYLLLILFLLPLLPVLSLGQKAFYIPKAMLTPFHDQKQQLHTLLGIGSGYDVNLSYAFIKHFAVFATGSLNKGTKKRRGLFGDRYNMVKDDLAFNYGLGYFKTSKGFFNVLETYAGYGTYKVDNFWYFPEDLSLGASLTQAHYRSVFWQVNAGKTKGKQQYGIAGRLSYSTYTDILFYDTHPNSAYIKSRYENLKGLTIEPAFCYGYNIKKVFVNAQAGLAVPLGRPTVTKIDTHSLNNNTIVVISNKKETLFGAFARLSLQYNFNFSKKIEEDAAVKALIEK
jgi:hypothetical protein